METDLVQNKQKKAYQTPSLVEWGSIADLTRGDSDGGFTDAEFTGTEFNPFSDGHV